MANETVDGQLDALRGPSLRIEGMVEVVRALRTDLSAIAEGVDPRLTASSLTTSRITACC